MSNAAVDTVDEMAGHAVSVSLPPCHSPSRVTSDWGPATTGATGAQEQRYTSAPQNHVTATVTQAPGPRKYDKSEAIPMEVASFGRQ